uniref:OTU domain-containing protein n=1 Tax=Plectus sambesii TaxID=2011161 RepID=A0A914XA52_9BILA
MTTAMKKAAVETPDFEYGGYTIKEYECIFVLKKEGMMLSFEEVEESMRKGIIDKVLLHRSHQLTQMAEQLEENFTGPYIHRLMKANITYLARMDGTVLKKTVSCGQLKLFIDKPASTAVTSISKSDESESEAYSTPIPIDSDVLIYDVITDRDLRFKPPTKGYMITNSAPLDLQRDVIVRPKFGTARLFNRTAAPKPKNIEKIIADGNCLFRAFSFCLTGSEEHHLTVRRVICDFMEFFSATWQPLVGTRTISEYLDRGVRTSGISREHWGTEIEILAFVDMCNCMVYVYNDHDSARKIKQYEGYRPRPRADRPATNIADLTNLFVVQRSQLLRSSVIALVIRLFFCAYFVCYSPVLIHN